MVLEYRSIFPYTWPCLLPYLDQNWSQIISMWYNMTWNITCLNIGKATRIVGVARSIFQATNCFLTSQVPYELHSPMCGWFVQRTRWDHMQWWELIIAYEHTSHSSNINCWPPNASPWRACKMRPPFIFYISWGIVEEEAYSPFRKWSPLMQPRHRIRVRALALQPWMYQFV